MPAPIHAIVVVRAEARPYVVTHLRETLHAITKQSLPVAAVTIVQCGSSTDVAAVIKRSGAEGVVATNLGTGYADAIALGARRVAEGHDVWLLAQDTVPTPSALAHLAAKLETALSVAVVAPKLVRADDPTILVSAGVAMTELGRIVTFGTGQIDQGQHDSTQDILGADIRGVLIRADEVKNLLPDPALAGADEGLDIGVRARLAGLRVDLAPEAIVAVHGDGVAGLPAPRKQRDKRRIFFSSRVAQLHRRLTYAPAWAVVLHILSFPFIAFGRSIQHLLDKQPARVLSEWGATVLAAVRWGAISRSRARIARTRSQFKRVAPLRLTPRQVKSAERQTIAEEVASSKSDVRFFSGGGAWVTLGALVASIAIFPALLTWPSLAGGAFLPLRDTVAQLWADTHFGFAGIGLDGPGPADPFSAVVAVIGTLSPAQPGMAFVVLWVLALPLAVLGGWFASTRVTERAGLRIAGALMWALAPSFLSVLMTPRPTAVIAHLVLPWFCYAVLIAHRSWGAAGAASLALVVIAACSPSLGLLLVVLCLIALVVFIFFGRLRASVRYLWTIVPTVVVFAPLVWRNFQLGTPLASIVDPGVVYAGSRADDSMLGRLLTASGFIDKDPGGWGAFLQTWELEKFAPYAALLIVPVAVVALTAVFFKRWRVGAALVLTAAVATVAAIAVTHISLSIVDNEGVAIWPGALVSLAWLAMILAALVVLDGAPVRRGVLSSLAFALTLLVAVSAVPQLTAPAREQAALAQGTSTTLPAFVAAEARNDRSVATLVLDPLGDGSFRARVVWGGTEALGARSTLLDTRTEITESDRALAAEVAAIVTPGAGTTADEIAAIGVRYVLVGAGAQGADAAAAREAAISSLNLRSGLTRIGETGKGALWRLDVDPASRGALAAHEKTVANLIGYSGVGVLIIAVLLAIPTPSSVRASRRKPRLVDARGAEEI